MEEGGNEMGWKLGKEMEYNIIEGKGEGRRKGREGEGSWKGRE